MSEILQKIHKDYGNVIMDTKSFLDKEQRIVSIGPCLDLASNGGIPEGSWVVFAAREKMGKTTTILNAARNAQRDLGMTILYADIEHRLKKMNIVGTPGLDSSPEKFVWLRSSKDKILYANDFLNIMLDYLRNQQIFLVVDSLSSLAPSKISDDGVGTELMGKQNHWTSDFINAATPLVAVHNSIVVLVAQYYTNTGKFGGYNIVKIASKGKYQADIQFVADKQKPDFIDDNGKIVGQKTTWRCDFAALPGGPGKVVDSYITYGEGIDEVFETIELGLIYSFIGKVGAGWMSLDYLKKCYGDDIEVPKVQGHKKLKALFAENPDYFKCLKDLIRKEIVCK